MVTPFFLVECCRGAGALGSSYDVKGREQFAISTVDGTRNNGFKLKDLEGPFQPKLLYDLHCSWKCSVWRQINPANAEDN